jgi:hypothetical protein
MRRIWGAAAAVLVLAATPALASGAPARPGASPLPELRSDAARSRADQLRTAREYKASLERLLVHRESDLQRALEQAERTRDLVDRGLVARNEVDTAERAVADARERLDQTWGEALVAATLIAKALAHDEIASGRRLPPGGEQASVTLIRYQGRRPWALSLIGGLQDFFVRTFGRALPVSAYGQTAVHDKLGFDHRNAIDLAIHPDTAEGRAVMDWLRKSGMSFIAFRSAVAGAATGAHIHVGEPSQRLASP